MSARRRSGRAVPRRVAAGLLLGAALSLACNAVDEGGSGSRAGRAARSAPRVGGRPKIEEAQLGGGILAERGRTVSIRYTATLVDDTVIGTTMGAEPLTFELGSDRVVQGLNEGIVGMRVGGKRRLVVPPELGYGDQGRPSLRGAPAVPPGATLVFRVELLEVR